MIAYESVSEVEHEQVQPTDAGAEEATTSKGISIWPVVGYIYVMPAAVSAILQFLGSS